MPNPSARDLLVRGLFHDRIIPPLSSLSLEDVYDEVVDFARTEMAKRAGQRMRPLLVRHSVPKLKHLRRHFGIPNPYAHIMLCLTVGKHWRQMTAVCDKSQISLSKPVASAKRALAAEHSRRVEGVRRAQSSVGARFMLKTDLATFYPSIYTHSIPWAIHGKQVHVQRGPKTGLEISSTYGFRPVRIAKPGAFQSGQIRRFSSRK